jgi:hypothetical protein
VTEALTVYDELNDPPVIFTVTGVYKATSPIGNANGTPVAIKIFFSVPLPEIIILEPVILPLDPIVKSLAPRSILPEEIARTPFTVVLPPKDALPPA